MKLIETVREIEKDFTLLSKLFKFYKFHNLMQLMYLKTTRGC